MRVRATATLDQSKSARLELELVQWLWSSADQPHTNWTNSRGLVIRNILAIPPIPFLARETVARHLQSSRTPCARLVAS